MLSRRKFLIGSGIIGGGLILGISLREQPAVPGTIEGSFQPNAWLQITGDGRFVYQLHKAEMGQGVITSLPLLFGEELDLDPARFEIAMAGVHPAFAGDPPVLQITGGSSSVSGNWEKLREAGAAARAMLVAAAADHWQVPIAKCTTDNGIITNQTTQQQLHYADVAEQAARFSDVSYQLKSPADYRWIGQDYPRLDLLSKTTGSAEFGIDVKLPDLKTAVVVRCPFYGGSVKAWHVESIIDRKGVIASFPIHSGIAIVAESYWQARQAAQALKVEWDKGPLAGVDNATIRKGQRQALTEQEPNIAMQRGEIDSLTATPYRAEYTAPFTHHSPMEPQNATARFSETDQGLIAEVWAPNQAPDICRALTAHYGKLPHENVRVHTTLMGGGFGRRGYPDYVGEVAAIARELPGTAVKLVWSREDDMRHDFYRPASLHQLEGHLDDSGRIHGWRHNVVAASIIRGFAVEMMAAALPTWVPTEMARSLGRTTGKWLAGSDPIAADGAEIPYSVPHISIGQIEHDPGIPIGFWRSVSQSFNVFASECFMDELCHQAGADPLSFRLKQLPADSRHRQALQLAAEQANWGKAPSGVSQGIAISQPFTTYCAMIAEVTLNPDSNEGHQFTIERIIAAVDCGRVIAPDTAKAQIEGGIIYGLGAALKDPVTFKDGRCEQSNFHDLPVMRMDEIPQIEVYFVDSELPPTGLGEIGVPAVAPAIANALFQATGQRLRDLPLQLKA